MTKNYITNRLIKSFYLVFLFVFVGCSQIQIPFLGKSTDSSDNINTAGEVENPAKESTKFVVEGNIVDGKRLQEGKNLAIIPFKAGINAEATYELDRAALMIVKGISDAFAEDKSGKHAHFKILTAENADDADLIVKGHITKMGGPSKLGRWVLFKRKKLLGVEGKIIDVQTGETVLSFNDFKDTNSKTENYKSLGHQIGKNIGQYILSGID